RLLTLTGPGGCGKTRLAIALAAGATDRFAEGVQFVSLAAIRDPSLVPVSIAHSIGLQDARGRSLLEHLSGFVGDGEGLRRGRAGGRRRGRGSPPVPRGAGRGKGTPRSRR